MRKLYTLDDLFNDSLKRNIEHFDSKDFDGNSVVVSIPATFSQDGNYDSEFYLKGRFNSCHTKLNVNKSYIENDVMEAAMPTFVNKPILASIVEKQDKDGNDTLDFNGHDMKISTDKMDKSKERVEYIETIVGVIPESCNMELVENKDTGKSELFVDGYVFRDYTYAADILEKRKGASVSIEIEISKYSFNAKENYLNIEEFKFRGITLLGESVEPGMQGAHVELEQAFTQNYSTIDENKLVEIMEKLNDTLSMFQIQQSDKKGGNDSVKLKELLEKYGKVVEDLTFEYEEMDDEELEEAFLKAFEYEEIEGEDDEPEVNENEEFSADPEATPDVTDEVKTFQKCTVNEEGNMQVAFELSHDDIRYGLYNLLGAYDEADNEYYYIRSVYDNYFVMQGWCQGLIYKQEYSVDGDNVSLKGERTQLFEMLLTESEKLELEDMRSNYSSIQKELESYQKAEKREEKLSVLKDEAYEQIAETEEFKNLISEIDSYSLDELQTKADLLFAKHVKSNMNFTVNKTNKNEVRFDINNANEDTSKAKPYGDLFD